MIKPLFTRLLAIIGSFFTLLLGRFEWTSPHWFYVLRRKAAADPKLFWGSLLGTVIFFIVCGYSYYWYKSRPQPLLVTAAITAPQITPIAKTLVPDILTINFGTQSTEFTPKSVAPLNLIGKEVTQGITLTPAMPGKWEWLSDSRLIFTPAQDWPAGQTYTIHFDKKVFSANAKLQKLTYTFETQAFKATIKELKFYQNPVDPKVRQAIATIEFNYPVDKKSFEDKISLMFESLKKSSLDFNMRHFKFDVTYDDVKRTAYLHSETLPLPETSRYLRLSIDKGVKSETSSATTNDTVSQTVLIPDAASYFKINNAAATIIRNEQDRPEQVLTIETTVGVTEAEINKSLHVYLLPQNYPATSTEAEKLNYEWLNPGEVTADILKLSTPLNMQPIPSDRDFSTLHSYKLKVDAPRFIFLKIDKGTKGFGDFALANDYMAVISVPEYPKEIGFLHKGALLALSGEKKLSVVIRGLPAVKFEIARVLPDNVNQLVTQTQGDFNNPNFINPSFNQQNISDIFSDIQQFNISDLSKAQYTALDLGRYLSSNANTGGPRGLFLLQATGWDIDKKIPLETKATRLILITDLGLLVKDNHDGSHDVFVQSITQGLPIANTKVSILGKNGIPILTRMTDSQGRANFPTLKDFIDEREPTVYLASVGNDVSFIPYNNSDRQLNYSRYDIGGLYNNQEQNSLSAYVFSDRGIYRPGDTAHIAMIVKQAYAKSQAAGLPLGVSITDPRGTTLLDKRFQLDESGYLTLDFPTNPTSPTGDYLVNLYIVKDNHFDSVLGSTTLRVAEFQPDRMRITSSFSQETGKGWISPKDLTAKVMLWNLYGAPAADRKISAKILLTPQRIQFNEYPQYIFVDPLLDPNKPPKVFTDTLAEVKTNDKGEALLNLNLERFDKATYQLTFFAEGFEAEGGRSVAAQSTALVSPLPYFVGYKADGDLSYVKQNSQRSINFVAIDPQLHKGKLNNLKIQLVALHPVTTLVKNPDGTYQYQSVIQTNVINTKPYAIEEQGTDFALPTDQIGDFAVNILDQNNTELSRLKYSVVGASQLALSKNAELSVKLNKSEFKAGEDIELQISAPYVGAGLISIERDKVYTTQWFKTNTTSSVQKIHIPKDFEGNGYVNVAYVRDWDSPEIFISPLSYSIAPFSVSHEDQAIHIDLMTPELARPGEPFVITYKSDKPGKIIVFAVDEGILQVAKYKTPDPLGFFFQKHALEVITQQTLDQILPKFMKERELSAVGGDGGENELRNHLNPFKRKTDLPVVYWSGIVDVDSTPRQLTYQVPDYFNGTLRVMAVAVANNAVGSTDKKSEIRGNFVINPNVPTFVAPGDEFDITASVANNIKESGSDAKVSVQLTTSPELEILGSSDQSIKIAENSEQTVHFKLRAKSQLGSANMTLVASANGKSSKMSSTLSVRPATHFMTSIASGNSKESTQSFALDRAFYPEYRSAEAAMSSSPLILVVGLQRYLDNFPYGCTEQLTSKALPLLAMNNQPWFSNDARLITDKVQATIQMLGQRQMSSGAFSYWPNGSVNASNPFASVYAMQFLTEAKEKGYDVPNEMFRAGLTYLKDLSSQNPSSMDEARIQAYAIYILTRNEIVTTNYLTHLQLYLDQDKAKAWHQDITSAYIAATYQLLKSNADAARLIRYFKPESKTVAQSTDFYNNNIADAQYLYLIAHHFPDLLSQVADKLVMPLVTAINSNEINTVLSGYTSIALSAYAQSYQSTNNAAYSISEIMDDNKEKTLPTLNNTYIKASIDNAVKKIIFNNPQKQSYFYQLTQAGFSNKPVKDSLKKGIEIDRDYRDSKGNVINSTSLGTEIEVHIHVRSLSDDSVNNVAIIDLLPGGFEVVSDSVKTNDIDYADVREDRVVFFTSINPNATEITYRIKATNNGKYTVPPVFAESMYNPNIQAHSMTGSMVVEP